jgi:tRNA modification GTPase
MFVLTDTIVAIATPPGEGAIGIIRLSGSDAITIANAIFPGKDLSIQPTHTLHFGKIVTGGQIIDEVVLSLYKGPKSYTGENIVEISCHGSGYILQQVVSACVQQGARMAKPGEFTLRAFLNGKLDLTQAEAVADLIASQSNTAHKAAMHALRGGFSHDLARMRDDLIQFSALIELELDFAEEDVEFADRTKFYALINEITNATQQLVNSFRLGNVIKNGVSVAIVGKPNAGKSTLLNALLNEERAIVSEIAGTTRDTIEETLNINGILFRLIDTAGIREHSIDQIELKGIERSKEAMNKADVVVYLFDAVDSSQSAVGSPLFTEQSGVKQLTVGNKVDAISQEVKRQIQTQYPDALLISAKNKENIHELKTALYNLVAHGNIQQEGTIVTNARHYAALQEVLNCLHEIKNGLDSHLAGDLISLDIRHCLYYLGEITGQVTTEDKLDYIFSKFCIGK